MLRPGRHVAKSGEREGELERGGQGPYAAEAMPMGREVSELGGEGSRRSSGSRSRSQYIFVALDSDEMSKKPKERPRRSRTRSGEVGEAAPWEIRSKRSGPLNRRSDGQDSG